MKRPARESVQETTATLLDEDAAGILRITTPPAPVEVEHVNNPTLLGIGLPWVTGNGSITVGGGLVTFLLGGYLQQDLLVPLVNGTAFTLRMAVLNLLGNSIVVKLINTAGGADQTIYSGSASGSIEISGTANNARNRIRVEVSAVITVSLTATLVSLKSLQ